MFYSPLRYPGGKNKLASFIAKICVDNNINGHYIEPYSGGASVALHLLIEGYVEKITINDKDRSIYAVWHSILRKTNQLIEKIESTEVTTENWHTMKKIQENKKKADLLELGFSTLFLNRTNRSGIITGGPIGGSEQEGEYKIDCRFNKEEIISRIRRIKKFQGKITLYTKDALKLITSIQEKEDNPENTIFYFDPPYYLKANSLYMNHYFKNDHERVGQSIRNIEEIKWIVSYDNHPSIKQIYQGFPLKEYTFNHAAFESREGKEILFFSRNLNIPDLTDKNPVHFRKKKKDSLEIIYKIGRKKSVAEKPI